MVWEDLFSLRPWLSCRKVFPEESHLVFVAVARVREAPSIKVAKYIGIYQACIHVC